MNTKILAVLLSFLLLAFVIELVRRERLTFKYASGWILVSIAALFFAVFDRFLSALSNWLGFVLPSNFIFFAVLSGFVFLSLLLTIFLCQQNDRNDRMAQKIALLEQEIAVLKQEQR